MKTISEYIIEKLKISSSKSTDIVMSTDIDDIVLNIDEDDIPSYYYDREFPDDRIHRKLNNGKELLWWKWWKILTYNGPQSKKTLNKAIGNDKEDSYSTIYAKFNRLNIITYNRKLRKLEAQPVSKWKV